MFRTTKFHLFGNTSKSLNSFEAIFTHLPENTSKALVRPMPSKDDFEDMPYLHENYFKLGFDAKKVFEASILGKAPDFPEAYDVDTYVSVKKAPVYKSLQFNQEYQFECFVPRGYEVVLIDPMDEWIYFENENGVFKLTYIPKSKGALTINLRHENGGNSYHTILAYQVGEGKEVI
jgi:hypothetical protein